MLGDALPLNAGECVPLTLILAAFIVVGGKVKLVMECGGDFHF